MKKLLKILLILLAIMNCMVLAGQLWPEGAPPFARTVNIMFLAGNLIFLLYKLLNGKRAL